MTPYAETNHIIMTMIGLLCHTDDCIDDDSFIVDW